MCIVQYFLSICSLSILTGKSVVKELQRIGYGSVISQVKLFLSK